MSERPREGPRAAAGREVGTVGRLLRRLERAGPAIIDLAARLVAIPSDSPAHDESAVAEALGAEAARLGLAAGEIVTARPNRPNLVIRMPGQAAGLRLILNGHMDTKPAGERADWRRDPTTAEVSDGRLHGLGAADMKGALAAMLHAAAALGAEGLPVRGELVLVFSADEEASGTLGLSHVLATTGLTADAALIGEPSGIDGPFDRLAIGARGFHGFTLRATGRRLHSGLAGTAAASPDAIRAIARAVDRLPAAVDFGQPRTAGIWLGPDLAITGLAAGISPGMLPGEAVARGEVRTILGMTRQATDRALREALARIPGVDGGLLGVELESESEDWPASAIDPTEPIVGALAGATARVIGRAPDLSVFPGATEAHLFAARGIPCVPAFGPGRLAAAHVPDESIAIEDLIAAAQIYALAIADYLA
ncbi:MAG: M20/M25/M40 family metallo-hydrolase [Chloroflexi bacterium]|nr:M20/M25/M40 family metallo-hydrolase [Chloroflexota bacterium]